MQEKDVSLGAGYRVGRKEKVWKDPRRGGVSSSWGHDRLKREKVMNADTAYVNLNEA